MTRTFNRTSVVAAGLALIASTVVATATPAAASTCVATSCAGHDNQHAGCAASDHKTVTGTYAWVTNNYSSTCRSNWASGGVTLAGLSYFTVEVITVVDRNGHLESMCFPGQSDTGELNEYCSSYDLGYRNGYTDMVDGTNVTEATTYVYDVNDHLIEHVTADF